MNFEIPDDEEIHEVTDHNGNICGYLFGKIPPWPLIEEINDYRMKTGYHGVNYHTRKING